MSPSDPCRRSDDDVDGSYLPIRLHQIHIIDQIEGQSFFGESMEAEELRHHRAGALVEVAGKMR